MSGRRLQCGKKEREYSSFSRPSGFGPDVDGSLHILVHTTYSFYAGEVPTAQIEPPTKKQTWVSYTEPSPYLVNNFDTFSAY